MIHFSIYFGAFTRKITIMTRINLVPVTSLMDEHLLAEHRELKRIPSMIRQGRVSFEGIPENFTLGTGHVKFFYNKLGFLQSRYEALYNECLKRGFQVQNYVENFTGIPESLFWDFLPNNEHMHISEERIQEKIKAKPEIYHYYGKKYERV